MLHLGLDVLFRDGLADVEAALHRSAVSLLTDQLAALVGLVLVHALRRADGVAKLESRQHGE